MYLKFLQHSSKWRGKTKNTHTTSHLLNPIFLPKPKAKRRTCDAFAGGFQFPSPAQACTRMRFIPLSILPALIAHSALQLAAAWSTQQHRASQEISLAAANRKENDGTIMYTSADITESMRHESQVEMEKVARLLQSKQSSILLIHSKDELIDYLSSNNIQNYLFDCDGVLYRGTDPMPEASQAIQSLLDNGKRVFFVTNNAASSRSELKNKLEKVLRLPEGTLDDDMMIGSAFVAAQYLRSKLIKDKEVGSKRVHVIGTAGLCQEVQTAGFNTSGGPDPIGTPSGMSRDELATYPFSEGGIDALVIGLDNDFNYRKLCIANVLLQRNPDALFVATNRDAFDLVGYDARHLP